MCLAGGLPLPKVYLIDDTALNAFATGRNPAHASVAITTGLRAQLTRDELQGVMAHEMSHVRNYDILYSMLIAVMIGTLVMVPTIYAIVHRKEKDDYTTGRERRRMRKIEAEKAVEVVNITHADKELSK